MNTSILTDNVYPLKDYRDPREQAVSVESVLASMKAHDAERRAAGLPPDYSHAPESVFDNALRGRLPASDICSACGHTRAQHFDHSGCILLGCEHAQTHHPTWPMNPVVYGDPYPSVTVEVRKTLLADCGPALAAFLSTFAHDDLLGIAHRLGKAAIAAYTKELAK